MILEVSDSGELILPAELVQAAPHTRLEAERQGEKVVLKPVAEGELKPRRTILDSPTWPGQFANPEDTFRREDLYDEDGR